MPRTRKNPNFEQSLERLETIVEQLESGEQSLENSLKLFEEGIALTRSCQQSLQDAEQKVKQLAADGDQAVLDDFDSEVQD